MRPSSGDAVAVPRTQNTVPNSATSTMPIVAPGDASDAGMEASANHPAARAPPGGARVVELGGEAFTPLYPLIRDFMLKPGSTA